MVRFPCLYQNRQKSATHVLFHVPGTAIHVIDLMDFSHLCQHFVEQLIHISCFNGVVNEKYVTMLLGLSCHLVDVVIVITMRRQDGAEHQHADGHLIVAIDLEHHGDEQEKCGGGAVDAGRCWWWQRRRPVHHAQHGLLDCAVTAAMGNTTTMALCHT